MPNINAKSCVAFAVLLLVLVQYSHQEVYTAIVDLEKLLKTEQLIVKSLDNYLKAEDERLTILRQFRANYFKMNGLASVNSESYLSNPVNAFLLVKRLTTDWKAVETLMVTGPAEIGRAAVQHVTNSSSNETFPSAEDLSGAAAALLRLQDTYKLDTSLIAGGKIPLRNGAGSPNIQYLSNQLELSAGDCFELGRHSYNNADHYHTVLWMQEALDRVVKEEVPTTEVPEILEYLAFSTYQEGNVRHALKLTNDLLALNPEHQRALGNKVYYEGAIKKTNQGVDRGDDDDSEVALDDFVTQSGGSKGPKEESERETYEALCRGEKRLSAKTESQLNCFYLNTNKSAYLRLVRIKVEEAFKKPRLLMFRDIITDSEIKIIKEMASPRLKRATVQNYKTGDLETAHYRISKSAWLKNSEHEVVKRVSQRVEDITGLNVQTAEELQVVNYGIGGHYEPHYDFARREEKNAFKNLGTGNRIATWLNYMSDVEAGGATVFPMLGVTLWPEKGSAAFWFNLHRSGDGDLLTRHAACPVLVGSKWVSNKWFHEIGQEFRHPCGMRRND